MLAVKRRAFRAFHEIHQWFAHELKIDLRDAVGTLKVGVYERGSSEALYSQTATATDGLALVTLKAEFLKSGSACCMTPGTEYEIRYSQGETTYRFPYPSRFSKVYGNTCTIRLGVALVNGKPRTRIVLYKVLSGA